MVKLVWCVTRKPGMSLEEFQRYWRDVHGPIAAKVPGVRRYIQSHVLPSAGDGEREAYDGIAEIWFDDHEAMQSSLASPEFHATAADGPNFLDMAGLVRFLTTEVRVIG